MPEKTKKIAVDFWINFGNTVGKFDSNFMIIFEIFWNDFVEVFRIHKWKRPENFREITEKITDWSCKNYP